MLYVTHDVTEARQFDRVLVLDQGRIVEDGSPQTLAATPTSRYRRLLQAQERANEQLTTGSTWRRIRLASGRIVSDQVHAFEHTA
jgi:ATP-binding cassette subfamily B protein